MKIYFLLIACLIFKCPFNSKAPDMANNIDQVKLAQKAALAFCTHYNFSEKSMKELVKPPISIVDVNRDSQDFKTYRWLGGGRGGEYVQVEISEGQAKVIVYGGYLHQEFGPWDYYNYQNEENIKN